MSKPYISHEEATIKSFKQDPDYAAEYLNAYGMKDVAESANLNPKTLYRTLSSAGNPELRSFQAILGAMGMRLAVTPLVREHHQQ